MFQDYFFIFYFLHFLFNVLKLLFISFGSMFQDLPSLTHTKNSLHFHSSFSLLLFYIHMSIAFHIILSQIYLIRQKMMSFSFNKWFYLVSTFQWHLHNSNVAVSFDHNSYEKAMTKEEGLCLLFSDGSLQFWCWSQTL